jgi:hypothetical protein
MIMTLDRPPLEDALGMPGARAVALLGPDGPTVLWWAGASAPGEQQTATVVALASAAAGLVALSEPGDELGDIILTSADAFHVIRLVEDGTFRIAHLTLRRAAANLAMARREFRLLIEGYTNRPRHAAVLPRRERGEPMSGVPDEDVAVDLPADWFALISEPYVTDERVLDRILVTLRSL